MDLFVKVWFYLKCGLGSVVALFLLMVLIGMFVDTPTADDAATEQAAFAKAREARLAREADTSAVQEESNKAEVIENKCDADLQCWVDRHGIEARVACSFRIEQLANYGFEWTDGWTELKFDIINWSDKDKGTLLLAGGNAKFQNGFGAWENNIRYWCEYDPSSKTAFNAGAQKF